MQASAFCIKHTPFWNGTAVEALTKMSLPQGFVPEVGPQKTNKDRFMTTDNSQNTPENPTQDELKTSLREADFPRASKMAESQFGTAPRDSEEEE